MQYHDIFILSKEPEIVEPNATSVVQIANTLTGLPGRKLIHYVLYLINLMTFSTLALRNWFSKNQVFSSRSYSATVAQIIFTGVDIGSVTDVSIDDANNVDIEKISETHPH